MKRGNVGSNLFLRGNHRPKLEIAWNMSKQSKATFLSQNGADCTNTYTNAPAAMINTLTASSTIKMSRNTNNANFKLAHDRSCSKQRNWYADRHTSLLSSFEMESECETDASPLFRTIVRKTTGSVRHCSGVTQKTTIRWRIQIEVKQLQWTATRCNLASRTFSKCQDTFDAHISMTHHKHMERSTHHEMMVHDNFDRLQHEKSWLCRIGKVSICFKMTLESETSNIIMKHTWCIIWWLLKRSVTQ
jgi:hypothetical protein